MPYSFRCRTCGRLEEGGHAGENLTPHACRVCGAGVTFNRAGIKSAVPENWECLADATEERLAELGLTLDDVEPHTPWPRGVNRDPQHIHVTVSDGAGTEDGA